MARTVLTISEAEVIDAIAFAVAKSNAPEEAKTAKEIQESTGKSYHAVAQALHALSKQGRLGVHKVKRQALDGVVRTTTGYTILAKAPKK